MGKIHYLIVDDEPDGAELVDMLLAPAQIQTTSVSNAYQALETLAEQRTSFSGLIVDLAMPGMDGFGLLNALRTNPTTADLLVIAMTAFHTPELKARALKAGFNAYFPKPLDTDVFLSALERLLK